MRQQLEVTYSFGPVPDKVADAVIPALLLDLARAEAAHDVDAQTAARAELERILRQDVTA